MNTPVYPVIQPTLERLGLDELSIANAYIQSQQDSPLIFTQDTLTCDMTQFLKAVSANDLTATDEDQLDLDNSPFKHILANHDQDQAMTSASNVCSGSSSDGDVTKKPTVDEPVQRRASQDCERTTHDNATTEDDEPTTTTNRSDCMTRPTKTQRCPTQDVIDNIRKLLAVTEDVSNHAEYSKILGKTSIVEKLVSQTSVLANNASFNRNALSSYLRYDVSWFNDKSALTKPPFVQLNVPFTGERSAFRYDSMSKPVHIADYQYSINSTVLPIRHESAIFYIDRFYAFWCRHANPANDKHPVCFRCQLANQLPVCFINTTWPCEFCVLSTWAEITARSKFICKAVNASSGSKWNAPSHASHKLPKRVKNQLDAMCCKSKTYLSPNLSDAKVQSFQARKRKAPADTNTESLDASFKITRPIKRARYYGKTGRRTLNAAESWYRNARDSGLDPKRHQYRATIYTSVNANLAWHAAQKGKAVDSSEYGQLCRQRCKLYAAMGADGILPTLPSENTPLPKDVEAVLDSIRNATDDSTPHATDDEDYTNTPRRTPSGRKKPITRRRPSASLGKAPATADNPIPDSLPDDDSQRNTDMTTTAYTFINRPTPTRPTTIDVLSQITCQDVERSPYHQFHQRDETVALCNVQSDHDAQAFSEGCDIRTKAHQLFDRVLIPEDADLLTYIDRRQQEDKRRLDSERTTGRFHETTASSAVRVNMYPYGVRSPRVGLEALDFGDRRLPGMTTETDPKVVLTQREARRAEENTRSCIAVLNLLKHALKTPLANGLDYDLRRLIEGCTDDLQKLQAERLVDEIRHRQRSMVNPDDMEAVREALILTDVLSMKGLWPEDPAV